MIFSKRRSLREAVENSIHNSSRAPCAKYESRHLFPIRASGVPFLLLAEVMFYQFLPEA
jgi:hypothetical protein